jgi:ketosteroid isomerase-like protein
MKVLATFFGTAAIALAMTACNQAPPAATGAADTHDADVKAISDNEVQWNQDYAAKDLDKITAHYADNAVLMTPDAEAVNGKDAVRGALKQLLSDPAVSLTFKASKVDVSRSGELGYTQGSYQLTLTDPKTHKPISLHGSYVTTYRKQADGTWKAETDIATSGAPPPALPKRKLL